MASWTTAKWQNTGERANQAINQANIGGSMAGPIGNPRPPSTAGKINSNMLAAASPKAFDLTQTTLIDTSAAEAAAAKCRTYTGAAGLAQLKADQANRTYYDAGCGWLYQPSDGINPIVDRGALGSYDGPVYGMPGEADAIGPGMTFTMDLDKARISQADSISKGTQGFKNMEGFTGTMLANTCKNMQYISKQDQDYYGFCTTSGRVIPIETDSSGGVSATYPDHITYGCLPDNIIPASSAPGGCSVVKEPSNEGYFNYKQANMQGEAAGAGLRQGLGIQGNLAEAFQQPVWSRHEGFANAQLTALGGCRSPLTSECIALAARNAGCSDQGTLIASLTGPAKGNQLVNTKAYKAYQSGANPGLTPAMFRDGKMTIGTAMQDFSALIGNITNGATEGVKMAARDLCLESGTYDSYDFCAQEMTNSTTIQTPDQLKCIQQDWVTNGGTPNGTAYPNAPTGQTYQSFLQNMWKMVSNMRSPNAITSQQATKQFVG